MRLYVKGFLFAYTLCLFHFLHGLTRPEIDYATMFVHPRIAKALQKQAEDEFERAIASVHPEIAAKLRQENTAKEQEIEQLIRKKIMTKLKQKDRSFILQRSKPYPCTQFATQQSADVAKLLNYKPQENELTAKLNLKAKKIERLVTLQKNFALLPPAGLFFLAAQAQKHLTSVLQHNPTRVFGFDDAAILSTIAPILPSICTALAGWFAYRELKRLLSAEAVAECKIYRQELKLEKLALKGEIKTLKEELSGLLKHAHENTQQACDKITQLEAELALVKTYYKKSEEQLKLILPKMDATLQQAQKVREIFEEEQKTHQDIFADNIEYQLNHLHIPGESDKSIKEKDQQQNAAPSTYLKIKKRRSLSLSHVESLTASSLEPVSTEIFKRKKPKETFIGKFYHTIFKHF